MSQTTLGIVIVAFDSGSDLIDAIKSIEKARQESNLSITTCVVDMHPNSLDAAVSSTVDIYIQNQKNRGFGFGCNKGIKSIQQETDAEFFMLMNPDITLHDSFFSELETIIDTRSADSMKLPISPLILFKEKMLAGRAKELFDLEEGQIITLVHGYKEFSFHDKYGRKFADGNHRDIRLRSDDFISTSLDFNLASIGMIRSPNFFDFLESKTLKSTDFNVHYLVNNSGSFYRPPFAAGDLDFGNIFIPGQWSERVCRQSWCGALVVLPREYIELVGFFDERFFLYYEDIEFSVRGTAIGLNPILYPKLLCFHGHSRSTNKNPRMRQKSISFGKALCVSICSNVFFAIILLMRHFFKLIRNLSPKRKSRLQMRADFSEFIETLRGIAGYVKR